MTKKNKTNEVEVKEEVKEETENPRVDEPEQQKLTVDSVLDQTKEAKFPVVLVIGVQDNGNLAFNTNVPQYQFMQHLLSRAAFELNIHEKNSSTNQ